MQKQRLLGSRLLGKQVLVQLDSFQYLPHVHIHLHICLEVETKAHFFLVRNGKDTSKWLLIVLGPTSSQVLGHSDSLTTNLPCALVTEG